MEDKTITTAQETAYRPPRKPTLPEFGPGVQVPASRPIAPHRAVDIGTVHEKPPMQDVCPARLERRCSSK